MKQRAQQHQIEGPPNTASRAPKGGAYREPMLGRVLAAIVLFACGLAGGAALAFFALERPALEAAQARMQQYEQDLAALRGHLTLALNDKAALEGRLMVEESTRQGLEASLRTAQGELGRAHDTIAFYEQLLPPGPKGAVSIRALDIERVGPNLKYRILLMRSGSNDKPFQGRLQFVAAGMQGGAEVSVELFPAMLVNGATLQQYAAAEAAVEEADSEESGPLDVEFAEFQRSSGLLALPPDFVPQVITVNLLEGSTLRVSRSVELPAPK